MFILFCILIFLVYTVGLFCIVLFYTFFFFMLLVCFILLIFFSSFVLSGFCASRFCLLLFQLVCCCSRPTLSPPLPLLDCDLAMVYLQCYMVDVGAAGQVSQQRLPENIFGRGRGRGGQEAFRRCADHVEEGQCVEKERANAKQTRRGARGWGGDT